MAASHLDRATKADRASGLISDPIRGLCGRTRHALRILHRMSSRQAEPPRLCGMSHHCCEQELSVDAVKAHDDQQHVRC